MNTQKQKEYIDKMYDELFHKTLVSKVSDYCSRDFTKLNNYDSSDYDDFVDHIKTLSESPDSAIFRLEYVVNIPGKVVLRAEVFIDKSPEGNTPDSLLMSYWSIDENNKISSCIEVEMSSES